MAIRQTAGRDALGGFAPKFAQLNDDVLFGQVWNRTDKLSLRDRSLVTVTALMAQGLTDSSFRYHLTTAKQNGVTRSQIGEILTHAAFYAGWPKAWAAFNMAKEVWAEEEDEAMAAHAASMPFPIGGPNEGYAQYFSGKSYLAPLSTQQVGIYNVTFEPGCRNHWHIHRASQGGRADTYLRGRARMVSGMGRAPAPPGPRRRGEHSGRGEALARRGEGQLDEPPGHRGAGRERPKPVSGAGGGRSVRGADLTLACL